MRNSASRAGIAALLLTVLAGAPGAATPEEATRLGRDLTPTGAERAGSDDGTIPPWTGGWTGGLGQAYREGDRRGDPFAADPVLFRITHDNAASYAGSLPEGLKRLLARDPDMALDVYPTRRSAALPDRITAAIRRNAATAHAGPGGIRFGVAGAAGGLPFPVPHDGAEAIWNHLLGFWGEARDDDMETYAVLADGRAELVHAYHETVQFPYYTETRPRLIFERRERTVEPPAAAEEGYIQKQPLDISLDPLEIFEYLPGERRVRRAPSLAYDTPDPFASGLRGFDDYYMFSGSPDRYDYTLLGKREMIVPYNNNRFCETPPREVLGPRHIRPQTMRYERHRVWVVDAQLARGASHLAPHRRFYLDEDSWMILYADAWDGQGRLWRFSEAATYLLPELPALVAGTQVSYDFEEGSYLLSLSFGAPGRSYRITPPHSPSAFDPESLARDAIR